MFWALLGGLSFCRHCIIRPQGLVWSEDYLTFISPSHLNQFLTFYENLWQMILLKLAKHIELCWNMIADFYSQLMTCLGLFHQFSRRQSRLVGAMHSPLPSFRFLIFFARIIWIVCSTYIYAPQNQGPGSKPARHIYVKLPIQVPLLADQRRWSCSFTMKIPVWPLWEEIKEINELEIWQVLTFVKTAR